MFETGKTVQNLLNQIKVFEKFESKAKAVLIVQGNTIQDFHDYFYSILDQIPERYYKSVKVDNQNNIWFCTSEGIFILHQ